VIAQVQLGAYRTYYSQYCPDFIEATRYLPETVVVNIIDGIPTILVDDDGYMLHFPKCSRPA
jgi:glutaredoxin-related protein